jgi:hypothetical protein
MRRFLFLLLLGSLVPLWAQKVELPNSPGSLRFAVIGDSGSGGKAQYEVAGQIVAYRKVFPFGIVLMLGDNLYGRGRPTRLRREIRAPL